MNGGAARFAGPLQPHFDALGAAWRAALAPVLASPATAALAAFVDARAAAGHTIYPPRPLAALDAGAPHEVRVVVLGQDPYHGPGQAHGYAFSVPEGVRPPPSLRNILVEVRRDLGCDPGCDPGCEPGGRAARSGGLLGWSAQGVLLLNTVLTVEQGLPGSHARRGWEGITDAIIDAVAAAPRPKVFLLWGAHAQAKRARIEAAGTAPLVLQANHPSPLSARRGPLPFLGCAHFSQANRYLASHGLPPVDWCGPGHG
jgi:uracil-DNA glycosylase